jgi:hypothetical protein
MSLTMAACSGTANSPASGSATSSAPASAVAGSSVTPAETASGPASRAPVAAQPSSGSAAEVAVKADWTAFFDPATPITQREALLEDGQKFSHYLQVQAAPGIAHLTTEQVTAVTVIHAMAVVTYNILISGTTSSSLSNLSGEAVYSKGTWQVSDADFCNLLLLENKGQTVPGC